jgi:hypothetical protein
MPSLLGVAALSGGLFILLWYKTLVALPIGRRPRFVYHPVFKWGVPVAATSLGGLGWYRLVMIGMRVAVPAFACMLLIAFLILRFDRYSADMRILYDRYLRIRREEPGLEDFEILYHVARWRYPQWSQDRIVELAAGKGIQELILLIVLNENKINPISDWELYRSIKNKAARITRHGV